MKKILILLKNKKLFLILFFFILPLGAGAQNLSQRFFGQILLQVESHGEAWYVDPGSLSRHYLGRPADAFGVMKSLGIGISNENLKKIPLDLSFFKGADTDNDGLPDEIEKALGTDLSIKDTDNDGYQDGEEVKNNFNPLGEGKAFFNNTFAQKQKGKILLQVESYGQAWYVSPNNAKRYFLGRPADAFEIMKKLGVGIKDEDLAKIRRSDPLAINGYSSYQQKGIVTSDGNFKIDLITIDLSNPKLKIITDTADNYNCKNNCQVKPLAKFVTAHNGFAGINGTYFCPYASCGATNYYFYPVYNSSLGKMINEDQLKWWTTGPIIAFDKDNKFYFFKDSREFKSVTDFEIKYQTKLQAAIGNKPKLIEEGAITLETSELDQKQKTVRSLRGAIAYKDNKIYLVIAYNATVPNLGKIMKALEVDYAINLDGGGSTALFYDDFYLVGPGRNIPNAIIFSESD